MKSKEELIEWIYNLQLQTLTDELKDDIVEKIEDLNRKKMNKSCYTCHVVKNISEMEEIGVWVCKDCLKKSENKRKKKKNK